MSGAGDINGDGFDDILIGASSADPNGNYDAGESYVVFGAASAAWRK
ncbi:integrin alpha [Crocosphaera watsonii]|uniref:Flagellar hook-length control protein FliK n=1 Tax=Crocosphaera watsonii WH 8502 TaxID=423474 RepID=T2IIQ8_CROWT|nr:FG-GAP repeat protein [Crocosphaera watsonii]CCQ52779.1 Flagellar hook-length control protein FliK [Crocosphaera watsonii WH 8502]